MATIGIREVIMIAVALMIIALILPLGLGLLGIAGDVVVNGSSGTGTYNNTLTLAEAIDPSVLTLLTVLIPVLAVIAVAIAFIPRGGSN